MPHCTRVVDIGVRYIFAFKPLRAAISNKQFLSSRDVFCGLEKCLCSRVSVVHDCMHIYMYVSCLHVRMHPWKSTHPIIHVFNPCSSRIGALMVVYNRSVTEIQSHMRLVVVEDIILEGLAPRKASRQK